MRLLAAFALALPLVAGSLAGAALADPGSVRAYVGSTTRDPLLGPVVVCDAAGNGVGGVCFAAPYGSGVVRIIVRDDHVPPTVRVPLMMYAYSGIGPLPADGEVVCPRNHEPVSFPFGPFVDRLVIGVGPWAGVGLGQGGPACVGAVGTTGTIEMQLRLPKT